RKIKDTHGERREAMNPGVSREIRYLDTDAERQELAADIRRVRQAVIQLAESVPEERHFEPRYHGWSLAAMLSHLNTIDQLSMWMIKLALLGIRPRISPETNDWLNDTSARIFQRRVVATTIRGMRKFEPSIIDFIMTLPMDRFSREVCS